jgi:hypothetical protein
VDPDDAYGRRLGPEFYEARLGPLPESSLYDRLGAEKGIGTLATALLRDLDRSGVAKKITALGPALAEKERPRIAAALTSFFTHLTGGPGEYEGPTAAELSRELELDADRWKLLRDSLAKTMRELGFPPEEQADLVRMLDAARK